MPCEVGVPAALTQPLTPEQSPAVVAIHTCDDKFTPNGVLRPANGKRPLDDRYKSITYVGGKNAMIPMTFDLALAIMFVLCGVRRGIKTPRYPKCCLFVALCTFYAST
jgi:hypothetical protein